MVDTMIMVIYESVYHVIVPPLICLRDVISIQISRQRQRCRSPEGRDSPAFALQTCLTKAKDGTVVIIYRHQRHIVLPLQ